MLDLFQGCSWHSYRVKPWFPIQFCWGKAQQRLGGDVSWIWGLKNTKANTPVYHACWVLRTQKKKLQTCSDAQPGLTRCFKRFFQWIRGLFLWTCSESALFTPCGRCLDGRGSDVQILKNDVTHSCTIGVISKGGCSSFVCSSFCFSKIVWQALLVGTLPRDACFLEGLRLLPFTASVHVISSS